MAKAAHPPLRGQVSLVATPQDLEEALADLRQESIVGLDTETRPAFRKGESHLPALVQVATARAVYLFQLRRTEFHPALAGLLSEPRTIKAGVSLKDDLRALKQVFAFEEKNMLDLGQVARAGGFGQTGVRNLAGILLACGYPKASRPPTGPRRNSPPRRSPTPPPTPGPAANCSCASRVWGCCGRIQAPRARRFPGRKGLVMTKSAGTYARCEGRFSTG